MHAAKRPNSTKIKSAETFLKAFPRKFIPSKYSRYTVSQSLVSRGRAYIRIKLAVRDYTEEDAWAYFRKGMI